MVTKLTLFAVALVTLGSTAFGQRQVYESQPQQYSPKQLWHAKSVLQHQAQHAVAEEMRRDFARQKKQFDQYMKFQQEQARQRAEEERLRTYGGYVNGVWINPRYYGPQPESKPADPNAKPVPKPRSGYFGGAYYNPNYRGK
jgi:hypothetical protein